jgi:hypothetical protein
VCYRRRRLSNDFFCPFCSKLTVLPALSVLAFHGIRSKKPVRNVKDEQRPNESVIAAQQGDWLPAWRINYLRDGGASGSNR